MSRAERLLRLRMWALTHVHRAELGSPEWAVRMARYERIAAAHQAVIA